MENNKNILRSNEEGNLPEVNIRQIEGVPPCYTQDELARLAIAYAGVFAGEPWREVSRCQDGFSSEPAGSQCEDCGEVRDEAYPLDEQMVVIANELNRPEAVCFVLEDEASGEVAGFSWGYSYQSSDEFIEDKYSGTGDGSEQLRQDVRQILADNEIGDKPFYYFSETGIIDDPRYRRRGMSKEFVRLRKEFAEKMGLDIVQRTNRESWMFRTMQAAGFTQIMGEAVDRPDVVSPDRVLFAKKVDKATS